MFGTAYWGGRHEWLQHAVLNGQKIEKADLDLLLTDDPAAAAAMVSAAHP